MPSNPNTPEQKREAAFEKAAKACLAHGASVMRLRMTLRRLYDNAKQA